MESKIWEEEGDKDRKDEIPTTRNYEEKDG